MYNRCAKPGQGIAEKQGLIRANFGENGDKPQNTYATDTNNRHKHIDKRCSDSPERTAHYVHQTKQTVTVSDNLKFPDRHFKNCRILWCIDTN